MKAWSPFEQEKRGLESVRVRGVVIRPQSRVRLRPGGSADIMDIALNGKEATVEAIEQDLENNILLAVTVDDDPGRDFGKNGKPAHRFFFRPDEIEPLSTKESV
jgi:hypothetical protein